MTDFNRGAHTTKWIPVKDLSVIWAQSQRELRKHRVNEIAAEFDPDLFDDLVVTLPNGHGIYHVVDGQHRRAAILHLYGEEEKVPCRIINATTPERAAEVFDKINHSRKSPNAVETFLVRVTAGKEAETHIHCIISKLGYRVARFQGRGIIMAPQALLTVYKAHGSQVLKEALETINATWGDDDTALVSDIIKGYGALLGEHRSHIQFKRLREVAGKVTPGQLLGKARYHGSQTGTPVAQGVKHVVVQAYNAGLRDGKL